MSRQKLKKNIKGKATPNSINLWSKLPRVYISHPHAQKCTKMWVDQRRHNQLICATNIYCHISFKVRVNRVVFSHCWYISTDRFCIPNLEKTIIINHIITQFGILDSCIWTIEKRSYRLKLECVASNWLNHFECLPALAVRAVFLLDCRRAHDSMK